MIETAAIIALLKGGYQTASKAGGVIKNRSAYGKVKKAISILENHRSDFEAASDLLDEAVFSLNPPPPQLKKAIKLLAAKKAEAALKDATRELLSANPNLHFVRRTIAEASDALPASDSQLRNVREMLSNADDFEKSTGRAKASKARARKGGRRRAGAKRASARKSRARKGGARKGGARKRRAHEGGARKSRAHKGVARKGGASKGAAKKGGRTAAKKGGARTSPPKGGARRSVR